jgi:hypothetical protein
MARSTVVWSGRRTVAAHVGGRHGGYVRLGEAVVPRRASFTLDGDDGAPDLRMAFEVRDGRPECVEVQITAKPDGRGIRSTDLGTFNLDNMVIAVFEEVAMTAVDRAEDGTIRLSFIGDETAARRAQRDLHEARKVRRGSVTRTELERVTAVYREHVDASPTQAVAMLLGYSTRTAARRVEQARAAGLLPKTTPGKRKA